MIDNFKLIEDFIFFKKEDNLYFHLQIIIRGKDIPNGPAKNQMIQSYLIRSKEDLIKKKDEIIEICERRKARAYINVSAKSFEATNKCMFKQLAIHNSNNCLHEINPQKILNSACGEVKSNNPVWIIDVDNPNELKEICGFFELYAIIPTKAGYHVLIFPTDLKEFKIKYPHVDIHKNNPTLLYYPKSLSND